MRFIVCGGRDYLGRTDLFDALDKLHSKVGIKLIIHGACCEKGNPANLTGADRWAQEWAQEREVPYFGVPAKWTELGNAAGPERNGRMAALKPDGVVAFPRANGQIGSGTQNMIDQAIRAGIKVWLPMQDAR